jgi:hypothetical protein
VVRLERWLRARGYDEEADRVAEVGAGLCGVTPHGELGDKGDGDQPIHDRSVS